MPKRKRSRKAASSSVGIPAAPFTEDHARITNEVVVKTEPVGDAEYDPMQSQSTKMMLGAINAAADTRIDHEPLIDTIKPDCDVKIENGFRPEMLENLHEVAYITRSNTSHAHKEIKPEKIVDKTTKSKRKKSVTKRTAKPKYEPVEIVVDGRKMVKCPLCNKMNTTRHRSGIKNHIRQAHTRDKPFKCYLCVSKFSISSALQDHMKKQHKNKEIHCLQCRRIFYAKEKLELHKFKCVANRSFECCLCSFKRVHMHEIKHHMRKMHTGEKVVKCTICSENFLDKGTLTTHIRRHHPEVMPFKCSLCMKIFQEKELFQWHEKRCRTFECHVCQYTRRNITLQILQAHMRKHTGERPYQCHLCNKSCSRQETLTDHLRRHRETYTLKCVQCHRAFSNATDLAEHQLNCRKRRYECHLCGFTKYGLSRNKFMRHMAIHTGIRTLQCNGCSNSFASYKSLADHLSKSDHPQLLATICPNCCYRFPSRADRDAHQSKCLHKRVECYLCQTTLKSLKKLKNHMVLNHTGLKRFNCKFCSRKYQRRLNWKMHEKTHTKIGLIKCQYCTKKFIDKKYKKKHENFCKKTYECYLCQKKFPSFEILHGKHMKEHVGRYYCRHCKKSSSSPRCYTTHVLDNHLHLYNFQCQTCNGIVKQPKDLVKHQKSCMKPIRKAKGINYFKCSRCRKELARVSHVRNHILSGECKNHPKRK